MDHSILDSVIKITNQRDVDSLEYSLVATLAEMVSFNEIGLYKLIEDGSQLFLEEVVKINFDDKKKPDEAIEWTKNPHAISRDKNIPTHNFWCY